MESLLFLRYTPYFKGHISSASTLSFYFNKIYAKIILQDNIGVLEHGLEYCVKILLTAINAKYIHSNLAVYSLRAYAGAYAGQIRIVEFTINNYMDDLLQAIYREKPDFIGFSCYIWNINLIDRLCIELRKVLPEVKIWLGGPEVSYDAKERLMTHPAIDGIMIGEGEETFREIMDYYLAGERTLAQIQGIAFRESAFLMDSLRGEKPEDAEPKDEESKDGQLEDDQLEEVQLEDDQLEDDQLEDGQLEEVQPDDSQQDKAQPEEIKITPPRKELDLSSLPFPYENMEDFKNKLIYYETSRGCPYSCSYCLSSVDKKVRLRDIELVKKELDIFLKYKVPQVKFVDRTFNCNRKHAMAIWKHISEHDNGVTNFHFEISADILGEEEIQLLGTMREGLVQLEIGVQSTNPATVKAIKRRMRFDKLGYAAEEIHKGRNIHEHLDLIAGLPFEDMKSFQNSFNEVYALKPDQFQLGFLKVLKGSAMHRESREWGIVYQSEPPFEVLYTKWLSYDEILVLKAVENMVEIYYNSGQFEYSIKYMEHFFCTPFELYNRLGSYYEKNNLAGIQSSRIKRYEILIDFMEEYSKSGEERAGGIDLEAFRSILVHDLYLRENLKSRPPFAPAYEQYKKKYRDFYFNDEKIREYLKPETKVIKTDQIKPFIHLEHYDIDMEKTAETGIITKADGFILYDYMHRNPLNSQARALPVELE